MVDGGNKLQHSLMKNDPFPRERCHRANCPLITDKGGCKEKCYQEHVNYTITCTACKDKTVIYIGESSRGCYIRYEQHMADYRRKEGFMWEHAQEYHQGQTDIKFSMIRVATDRDPMRRIVRESIRIIENRKDETVHLLNSKKEWFGISAIQPAFTQE